MKHTILCVDDEVDNVDALERLFRRKYNVLKATSGAEALKIMKSEKVSVIVTDQRMPNMTGVEFLSATMKTQPDVIRILLTGFTDIDSVISAINSGQVYRYVTKPWDPVDLSNTVDKAIERFELSAELKEKNQALSLALKELKTLDEAKSNFMILINHELKTPLTVMISFLSLLQETDLTDEQLKYASRINTSAERLQSLINDSLELVSAETGTLPIKVTGINLKKLMAELKKEYQPQLDAKSMTLDLVLAAEDVRADAKALRSVLARLLDNAIKFGHEKSTIELESREDGANVQLSLVNEGKGLKADVLAKIMQPFSLDEDIMHHSKGTGLGLSVVQALLKRLGSQLEVESPKGKFSASFSLPSG
ncbi:MAG: response regulator [Bdellovibrionales bacterium]